MIDRILRSRVAVASIVVVLAFLALGLATGAVKAPSGSSSHEHTMAPFSARLVKNDVIVEASLEPAHVGTSEVHLMFSPPGGLLQPVSNVRVSLTLPKGDLPALQVTMEEVGANHWSGSVKLPVAGDWSMEIRAVPKTGAELDYLTTVPVED